MSGDDGGAHAAFLDDGGDVIGGLGEVVGRGEGGLAAAAQVEGEAVEVAGEVVHLGAPEGAVAGPAVDEYERRGALPRLVVPEGGVPDLKLRH